VSISADQWHRACDQVVAALLGSSVSAQPVDAMAVATAMGFRVIADAAQAGRARLQRIAGTPTIFVKPGDRPERLQWAVAHELGEAHCWQVCQQVNVDPSELSLLQREQLANALAQRLLLPTGRFTAAVQDTDGDLRQLKLRFATASHELIAQRLLDFPAATILTVIDQGTVSRRTSNLPGPRPTMHQQERACCEQARQTGRDHRSEFAWDESCVAVCNVWAIHEPGWQREIALTRLSGFDE
jgi:hypothetical protein